MIGAVGTESHLAQRPGEGVRGNRAGAPGQAAKSAVSAARDAGVALPKNAQGLAASSIAKGVDPASIFQALVAPSEGPLASDRDGDHNSGVPIAPVDQGPVVGNLEGAADPDLAADVSELSFSDIDQPDTPQSGGNLVQTIFDITGVDDENEVFT